MQINKKKLRNKIRYGYEYSATERNIFVNCVFAIYIRNYYTSISKRKNKKRHITYKGEYARARTHTRTHARTHTHTSHI